jgi:hypothetical protein
LSEEIAKPLERYRPSFDRQIAKVKKFPSLPQNEPGRGQKNGKYTENYSRETNV